MIPALFRAVAVAVLIVWHPSCTAVEPTARANAPRKTFQRPRGVFVLDGRRGTRHKGYSLRDANIRDYPFVDGYVLRTRWDKVEMKKGDYDFFIIDNILKKLPKGQQLSLILMPLEPQYIAATPQVTTWIDTNRWVGRAKRPVPWDPLLRERRRAFIEALATHIVDGVSLRDHPALEAVNPYMPGGHTGIRNPVHKALMGLPGYTRDGFLSVVREELCLLTTNFPNQFVQIGFWKFRDDEGGPEAWEEIRQALLTEFNGIVRPRVGFFMENLAASRPAPGTQPVTGRPNVEYGAPLFLSNTHTWTAFQALTSWRRPFVGHEKVVNATPVDGMRYAYDTYGTTYFEIYAVDIDQRAWHVDFQEWHNFLHHTSGGSK